MKNRIRIRSQNLDQDPSSLNSGSNHSPRIRNQLVSALNRLLPHVRALAPDRRILRWFTKVAASDDGWIDKWLVDGYHVMTSPPI